MHAHGGYTGSHWEAWPRAIDVAVDAAAARIIMLDRAQGIVGAPLTPAPGPSLAPARASAPSLTPLPASTPTESSAVAEALEAAVAGLIPPAALAGRVGAALFVPGASNPLALFVAGLVDALPKQVGAPVDITAQLAGKGARLGGLLEVLHQAGLLDDLSPELLRCVCIRRACDVHATCDESLV